jgi:hypothetical protein
MYKNAGRFSQRATRSDYTLGRSGSRSEAGRHGRNAAAKSRQRSAFVALLRQAGQGAYLEYVEQVLQQQGLPRTVNALVKTLNSRGVTDPSGYPWRLSTGQVLLDELLARDHMRWQIARGKKEP